MEELLLLIQKSYGLIGVILFLPVIGLVVVWKQNTKLQAEVVKATKGAGEVQEMRVKDAQAINMKLIEVVKEQTSLNTETNLALERLGDALNDLQNELQNQRKGAR
jgi:hypothetical protein